MSKTNEYILIRVVVNQIVYLLNSIFSLEKKKGNLICPKLYNSSAEREVLVLMLVIFLYCVIHVDFTKTYSHNQKMFYPEKYITLKTILLVD